MRSKFQLAAVTTLVFLISASFLSFAQQSASLPQHPADATTQPTTQTQKDASVASAMPNKPESEAQQLYRTGKLDAAADAYQKLVATDPAVAYAGLARVYLRQKKVSDAYDAAKKATEAAPDSPDARLALGEVYFRQGKIPEADQEFVDAANSGRGGARAFLDVARVDRVTSYYAKAKSMIEIAHGLDPDDPDVRREWLATLPLDVRLKELQSSPSGAMNDDADDRSGLSSFALLEEAVLEPHRTCQQVNDVTATQTPLLQLLYDPRHIRGYGLSVNVNGANAKLMLDTGASGILIDRRLADKAGIKPVVKAEMQGVGDNNSMTGSIGFADSIKIGELEFHDCRVQIADRDSVLGEDGLIGADVFEHYLVDINLPDSKFSLSELPRPPQAGQEPHELEAGPNGSAAWHDPYVPPQMKDFSPVYRFGHMLFIPTRVNRSAPVLFLIDTGSSSNSISPEEARQVSKLHLAGNQRLSGFNGKISKSYFTDKLTLQFGHFEQDNESLFAFDLSGLSNSIGTEISGTLGFPLLYMMDVKIDYRDGLVNFTFERRAHPPRSFQ